MQSRGASGQKWAERTVYDLVTLDDELLQEAMLSPMTLGAAPTAMRNMGTPDEYVRAAVVVRMAIMNYFPVGVDLDDDYIIAGLVDAMQGQELLSGPDDPLEDVARSRAAWLSALALVSDSRMGVELPTLGALMARGAEMPSVVAQLKPFEGKIGNVFVPRMTTAFEQQMTAQMVEAGRHLIGTPSEHAAGIIPAGADSQFVCQLFTPESLRSAMQETETGMTTPVVIRQQYRSPLNQRLVSAPQIIAVGFVSRFARVVRRASNGKYSVYPLWPEESSLPGGDPPIVLVLPTGKYSTERLREMVRVAAEQI